MSEKSTDKPKFPFGETVTLEMRGGKVISHSRPMTRQDCVREFKLKAAPGETRIMCPCGDYYSDDAMRVARHILVKFDKPHIYWIEANGLDPRELLLMKGGYKKLALFLEKWAKGEENKP